MTSQKAAWGRIRDTYANNLETGASSPSIFDALNLEYREGRITEAARDAMREHVKLWLGDPDDTDHWRDWGTVRDYAKYACGIWAPTAAPWGTGETSIILMAVQILEEEVA